MEEGRAEPLPVVPNVPTVSQEKTLHEAAREGNLDEVRKQLQVPGADVNARVADKTPLMYAASEGQAAVVKMLLDAGADRSIVTKTGRTAMELANQKRAKPVAGEDPQVQEQRFQPVVALLQAPKAPAEEAPQPPPPHQLHQPIEPAPQTAEAQHLAAAARAAEEARERQAIDERVESEYQTILANAQADAVKESEAAEEARERQAIDERVESEYQTILANAQADAVKESEAAEEARSDKQ